MRRTSLLIAAAAFTALTTGCATNGETKYAPSSYRESLDKEVMLAVEANARYTGTEVYWINPPRKTSKKD